MSTTTNTKKDRYPITMAIVVAIYLLFRFLPPIDPITPAGMQVVGLLLCAMVLWIFVGIGWTSLFIIFMLPTTGVLTFNQTLQGSWGNSITIMVLTCLLLNYCMRETGLLQRISINIMTAKFARGKTWAFFTMYCVAVFAIACFMPLTASSIVCMTLGEQILMGCGYEKGGKDHTGDVFACATAWITAVATSATLIAHAYPLMVVDYALENYSLAVSFTKYSLICIPMGLIFIAAFLLVCKFIVKPDFSKLKNADFDALRSKLPPMSSNEKIVAGVFIAILLCWLLPDFFKFAGLTGVAGFLSKFGSTGPVMLGVCLLFAIRPKGKPIAIFKDAMSGVAWEAVLMIACAMVLGSYISNDAAGINAFLSLNIGNLLSNSSGLVFIAIAMAFLVLQTNFMSNGVCAVMAMVIAPIAAGVPGLNPGIVAILIGVASNFSFMTAASTTSTAYVLGLKWTDPGFMAKYGAIMAVLGWAILTFVVYPAATVLWV